MLGFRVGNGYVTIDPAIDPSWDGLSLKYQLWGKEYVFTYRVKKQGCGVALVRAGEKELINPCEKETGAYRAAGITLEQSWFENLKTNQIEIELL